VVSAVEGKLNKIDPRTNTIVATSQPTGYNAQGIAVGAGSVWVAVADDQRVFRIDPETMQVIGSQPFKSGVVLFHEGSLWVADDERGLLRLTPS
jgi:streptogramin lyase